MAKILIVDDEPRIRELIRENLQYSGYTCEEAGDGSAALSLLTGGGYDLVILDLMMPFMDGMTCLREMRTRRINTPVIILTARGTLQDRLCGLDAGADDYLVKPFILAELLARVRALARRSYGFENEAIEIRGLSLHVPTRRVTVSARHIDLTASEYALLETLMLRADRVLTRRFLEERIFGNKENLSNALDVHMGNLRRKIGDGYVRTVRGVGYVIDTVSIQKVSG